MPREKFPRSYETKILCKLYIPGEIQQKIIEKLIIDPLEDKF